MFIKSMRRLQFLPRNVGRVAVAATVRTRSLMYFVAGPQAVKRLGKYSRGKNVAASDSVWWNHVACVVTNKGRIHNRLAINQSINQCFIVQLNGT